MSNKVTKIDGRCRSCSYDLYYTRISMEVDVVRWLIAVLFLVLACSARASESRGIPQIVDADTVVLNGQKIRLQGIDAPETDQTCLDASGKPFRCGLHARDALAKRSEGTVWACQFSGVDRYGRMLATCSTDGEDVGKWLVEEGWALAFRRYSTLYVADEDVAREAQRGLWSSSFIAPWDWRSRSRNTIVLRATSISAAASRLLTGASAEVAPAPGCAIKGNLRSKSACIYHLPGGRFYDGLDMTDRAARRWFCSEVEAQTAGCRRSKL
ncbi:nuclease [Bradyrhizobium sp. CCBAU 051011]|uniref:thermonuclease family protein n=1 Tax=Bradyrhizobium sp. CCBAU 051011 TaxID=858422 RepID=UPI001374325F|nr:nuclease [Bradyrhizobium sp. CCBAU 051011]